MNKPALDPLFRSYLSQKPSLTYVKEDDGRLRKAIINTLEVVFGRRKIERIYRDLKQKDFDLQLFFKEAIARSGLQPVYYGLQPEDIDIDGPVIFLANHPFGIIDGLLFCDLALRTKGDFRIMINALLCQDEELAPYFLPIDFESNKTAMKTNIRSKQLALECLAQGVPLLIFPAGMVSTANKMGFGGVKDAQWTTFAAKVVRESKATVLPIYFHGRNSRKFHIMSHIAEPLRMGMLMHEAVNKFGHQIGITIGQPIHWTQELVDMSRMQLTNHLYQSINTLKYQR